MTFAPQPLKDLAALLEANGVVFLGHVGNEAHKKKKFSYHLGADDLKPGASSATLPRDKAGLSNAASAVDIGFVGGTVEGLRRMSLWLVEECLAGAPDASDIREIIFSHDGSLVSRWDGMNGLPGVVRPGPGQGDNSHRKHTHVSFFRDSETRDKLALFKRFFEEDDVRITAIKGEDWKPAANADGDSNGVVRASPDRRAPIVVRLPLETVVRTIAEITAGGDYLRLTEHLEAPGYLLRSDWVPLVQGGDKATDEALDAYIRRTGA
jgi:hypothetical protein